MESLNEEDFEPYAKKYNWACVPEILLSEADKKLKFPQRLVQMTRELNPLVSAGFVVRDKAFKRVKVLSVQFSSIKKLCWNSEDEFRNRKFMLEIVRCNENSQFLKRLEIFKRLMIKVQKVGRYVSRM